MVLNALRIALRGLVINPEAQKKRHDDPVASSTGRRQLLSCIGQEYGAVGFSSNQTSSLEPRDILGNRGRFHAKPFGDVDRSGLSARLDQFCDQLDVILRHLALMRLTHDCKPLSLCFRVSLGNFKRFTLIWLRLCHIRTVQRDSGIDNVFALGRYISHV